MLEILRNMWRRKLRTILTILGIAIGIFAFTVMGAMALKFNKMIDGAKKYVTGQITVTPKGNNAFWGGGGGGEMLPIDVLNKMKKVEGVESVTAMVEMPLEEPKDEGDAQMMSFGAPDLIVAMDLESDYRNRNWETLTMKDGRMIQKGDGEDQVTIGHNLAIQKKLNVGDKMEIRGREFTIVGIIDQTMTGPDTIVFMALKPSRELLVEANPFLKSLKEQADKATNISDKEFKRMSKKNQEQITQAKAFKMEDISTGAGVSWKEKTDPEDVVARLKDQFKDEVIVYSPRKMSEEIGKASATFNALILGSAVIALLVGGFSIINTMMMSIAERTREIGIKKALGASSLVIASEYTIEAGVIGFLGGLAGVGLGSFVAYLLNSKLMPEGAEIFLLEPKFLIGVVIFSLVLGMIAGLIPALRAARLKIVDALKEVI
ncbi:MAG: hypothetical protein ACD_63C00073G0004 [uncultured bacterium]|nr:MAG: hypothetical protein ACD_63C00073G0004 [uncultured bacterium]